MGGAGSGNWYRSGKRDTVEDAWSLDVAWMTREGFFDGQWSRSGNIRWTSSRTGEETSKIGYEVNVPGRWLRLMYTLTRREEDFDYKIPLLTSDLPWGGFRWWFKCALTTNGRYCGRRVGKLFLPPGGRYYGCRHCHDLTYTTCQESHRFDRMWRSVAAQLNTDIESAKVAWDGDIREGRRMERAAARREQLKRRRQARGY
jgi:hypothetical protein